MKRIRVINTIILLNFLFPLNTVRVDGQVALSRHWLRGKFSGQKTEMNLMNIADSLSGLQSEDSGNSNDGDRERTQPLMSSLQYSNKKRLINPNTEEPPITKPDESLLLAETSIQKFMDKYNQVLNNYYSKISAPFDYILTENLYPDSIHFKWGRRPEGKLCRAIFVEAMDSWSKARNNPCNCLKPN